MEYLYTCNYAPFISAWGSLRPFCRLHIRTGVSHPHPELLCSVSVSSWNLSSSGRRLVPTSGYATHPVCLRLEVYPDCSGAAQPVLLGKMSPFKSMEMNKQTKNRRIHSDVNNKPEKKNLLPQLHDQFMYF